MAILARNKVFLLPAAVLLLIISAALLSADAAVTPIFTLLVSPELPTAGQRVTVSSLATNFTASTTVFTWFREGTPVPIASGKGISKISLVPAPEANGAMRIRLEVDPGPGFTPKGESVTILILPSSAVSGGGENQIDEDFTLEASSVNPDAGETVTLEVITFAFDRSAASYRWYIDGILQRDASGRGRSKFSTQAGSEGTAKNIRTEVTLPNGSVHAKNAAIQTLSAPLYWWADAAVPYWYKGKALPSVGSRVTIFALPNVRNPSGISYQWRTNGSIDVSASGTDKPTFPLRLNFPVAEEVEVSMRDSAGAFAKTVRMEIEPALPRVGIYELRPLSGIVFERLLTEFSAPAGEPYDFLAVPFFFPTGPPPRYTWVFNGETISGTFTAPWRFTLESDPGETSVNDLRLEVAGTRSTQRAASNVRINLR